MSVGEPRQRKPGAVSRGALERQEAALRVHASRGGESADAVLCQHPMARHDDRPSITSHGGAYDARRARAPSTDREGAIARRLTIADLAQCGVDRLFCRRDACLIERRCTEIRRIASEIAAQHVAPPSDLGGRMVARRPTIAAMNWSLARWQTNSDEAEIGPLQGADAPGRLEEICPRHRGPVALCVGTG